MRNGGAWPAENWLVRDLQAILIYRDIFSGQNVDDSGHRHGSARVNSQNAGVWSLREERLHEKHTWHGQIARIGHLPGDFAFSVVARGGSSDTRHQQLRAGRIGRDRAIAGP